jgi:hypothetical protein
MFEAHRSDNGESPSLIRRDGDGYTIVETDRDWRAWQACAEALALAEPLKNAARYLFLRSTKAAAFKTPFIGYRTFDGFSHFREDFADEQVDEAMEKAALTRTERMRDYRGESSLPQFNDVKFACEAANVSQEAWNRLRYHIAERK